MNTPNERNRKSTDNGRIWAGAIILGLGVILLANRLNIHWFFFPSWIFSWPMILIVIGLVIGGNSNFKNPASYILLIIGGFFLMNNIWDWELRRYIWPAAIIGFGIWLLMDKKHKEVSPPPVDGNRYGSPSDTHNSWDKRVVDESATSENDNASTHGEEHKQGSTGDYSSTHDANDYNQQSRSSSSGFVDDDYVKITSIFGDIRRMVISKNFLGGEIVTIFGGSNINLIQADIKHPVTIDVFQLFAGTKIIVPAHWKVKSEVTSVFGDVDDRRFVHHAGQHDDNKILYIRGTSIFGGVTIKSI